MSINFIDIFTLNLRFFLILLQISLLTRSFFADVFEQYLSDRPCVYNLQSKFKTTTLTHLDSLSKMQVVNLKLSLSDKILGLEILIKTARYHTVIKLSYLVCTSAVQPLEILRRGKNVYLPRVKP